MVIWSLLCNRLNVLRYLGTRHGVFVFGIRIRKYSNTNSKVFVFVFEYFPKYSDSEYFHEYFMNTCENIGHKRRLLIEAVIL